jgi:hypothetical protein
VQLTTEGYKDVVQANIGHESRATRLLAARSI